MSNLKYEIVEGQKIIRSTRRKGYAMISGATGRRKVRKDIYEPNGIFTGRIFAEHLESMTADWGDGVETKVFTKQEFIAEIESNTDRNLVERRTKAVLEALRKLEEQ